MLSSNTRLHVSLFRNMLHEQVLYISCVFWGLISYQVMLTPHSTQALPLAIRHICSSGESVDMAKSDQYGLG